MEHKKNFLFLDTNKQKEKKTASFNVTLLSCGYHWKAFLDKSSFSSLNAESVFCCSLMAFCYIILRRIPDK